MPKQIARHIYYRWLSPRIRQTIDRIRYPERHPRNIFRPGFERTRSIYIHIPKTAGVSIATALYGEDTWHHSLHLFEERDPIRYRNYFKFSFVRNPWDRLVSIYAYARQITRMDPYSPLSHIGRYSDFTEFVMKQVRHDTVTHDFFLMPQWMYVTDKKGNIGLDFLGRFECLSRDFTRISRQLEISATLPSLNATRHAHYSLYYTSVTRRIVADAYEADISSFGYRFQ